MMPVFADGDTGIWVGIAGLVVAVATGIVALLKGRDKTKDNNAKRQAKVRRDTLNEVYELVDRQAEDLKEAREQIHELRDKVNEVQVKLAVCEVEHREKDRQIAVMAAALRKANIPVDLTPGASLPPGGKGGGDV